MKKQYIKHPTLILSSIISLIFTLIIWLNELKDIAYYSQRIYYGTVLIITMTILTNFILSGLFYFMIYIVSKMFSKKSVEDIIKLENDNNCETIKPFFKNPLGYIFSLLSGLIITATLFLDNLVIYGSYNEYGWTGIMLFIILCLIVATVVFIITEFVLFIAYIFINEKR